MKRETPQRQRPLFHDGPVWQQLDERIQQQLMERLSDICHVIVAAIVQPSADQPLTHPQEEPDDRNN